MRNGRNRARGGILEEIVRTASGVVSGSILDSVRDLVRGLLHEGRIRVVQTVLTALTLGFGVVMVLIGAFRSLCLIPIPEAAAYAIVGLVSLSVGLILLLAPGRRP